MKDKHPHTALRFNRNEFSVMLNPKANYLHHTAVAEYDDKIVLSQLIAGRGYYTVCSWQLQTEIRFNYKQEWQWNCSLQKSVSLSFVICVKSGQYRVYEISAGHRAT